MKEILLGLATGFILVMLFSYGLKMGEDVKDKAIRDSLTIEKLKLEIEIKKLELQIKTQP